LGAKLTGKASKEHESKLSSLHLHHRRCATPATAQTLMREPEMGTLREGQRMLVDDGTCPAGKI
jgi:hypothetical protein